MDELADSDFRCTKQTGDEAAAALSRMTDVDVILELEGGSVKFGTDQGEYCLVTNEVAMAEFDTDELLLGGGGVSILRSETPENRDRYANTLVLIGKLVETIASEVGRPDAASETLARAGAEVATAGEGDAVGASSISRPLKEDRMVLRDTSLPADESGCRLRRSPRESTSKQSIFAGPTGMAWSA